MNIVYPPLQAFGSLIFEPPWEITKVHWWLPDFGISCLLRQHHSLKNALNFQGVTGEDHDDEHDDENEHYDEHEHDDED